MTLNPAEINLAVVDAHMQGEAADPESIMNLYADGIVLDLPSRGLRFTTPETILANYKAMFAAIELLSMRPLDRFATHNRVVDDCVVTFRVKGAGYTGLPYPIGAVVELRLFHVFEMQDGKIARETVFESWKPAE